MKRKILIALLTLGTVGGFASGIASMSCRAKHKREAFEKRVAETCVRAARDVDRDDAEAEDDDEPKRHKRGWHHRDHHDRHDRHDR